MEDMERYGPFAKQGDRVGLTIKCYGTTPALILEAWTTVAVNGWQETTNAMPSQLPFQLPELIKDDDTGVDLTVPIDAEIDEALKSFRTTEHKFRFALEFRATIKYRDVFQKKASWTTTSRYVWKVILNAQDSGGVDGWQEYEHVNREDENTA
jgi:hypothetical protein